MKRLTFLLTALIILPFAMSAQHSEKIQQAYTAEEIEAIVAQDPNELAFLEFAADRMAERQTMRGDLSSMPEISELNAQRKNSSIPEINASNFSLATFNPLAYSINLDNEVHYYRIGDTDQVIQVLSFQRVRHLFDTGQ
jgi:hypothetical protein